MSEAHCEITWKVVREINELIHDLVTLNLSINRLLTAHASWPREGPGAGPRAAAGGGVRRPQAWGPCLGHEA